MDVGSTEAKRLVSPSVEGGLRRIGSRSLGDAEAKVSHQGLAQAPSKRADASSCVLLEISQRCDVDYRNGRREVQLGVMLVTPTRGSQEGVHCGVAGYTNRPRRSESGS